MCSWGTWAREHREHISIHLQAALKRNVLNTRVLFVVVVVVVGFPQHTAELNGFICFHSKLSFFTCLIVSSSSTFHMKVRRTVIFHFPIVHQIRIIKGDCWVLTLRLSFRSHLSSCLWNFISLLKERIVSSCFIPVTAALNSGNIWVDVQPGRTTDQFSDLLTGPSPFFLTFVASLWINEFHVIVLKRLRLFFRVPRRRT